MACLISAILYLEQLLLSGACKDPPQARKKSIPRISMQRVCLAYVRNGIIIFCDLVIVKDSEMFLPKQILGLDIKSIVSA